MPNKVTEKTLYNINEVEIFSAGTWNGDKYTVEDLDNMVQAFKDTAETSRPYLKLGHDDKQDLLQEDGYPAIGWVGNLYRKGEKLVADFIDIPEKIYELIKNKAYRNVSSEIYWNLSMGEKKYPYLLGGVALLGADMPAVSNLKDILAMYKSLLQKGAEIKSYQLELDAFKIKKYELVKEEEVMDMTGEEKDKLESEIKDYKAKLEQLETSQKDALDKQTESEKELSELREFKMKAELEKAEMLLNSQVDEIVKSEYGCEAVKDHLKQLLGTEKKAYTVKDIEVSKFELVKEILKFAHEAAKLNVKEVTVDGEKIPQGADIDAKIKEYMAEADCSYIQAYKHICKKYNVK